MAHGQLVATPLELPIWKTTFSWICAILIGLLFLVAGVWKLTDHLGAAARMTQALIPAQLSVFTAVFFGTAEVFTGMAGKFVQVEDTVKSFKAVVEGEYDHLPESAFYMVGGIEEAIEKAKKI